LKRYSSLLLPAPNSNLNLKTGFVGNLEIFHNHRASLKMMKMLLKKEREFYLATLMMILFASKI
jgi:hypothetical protein